MTARKTAAKKKTVTAKSKSHPAHTSKKGMMAMIANWF